MQTIFPEGTNQVEKSRKYQGMGGGGLWIAPFGMEIPGGV